MRVIVHVLKNSIKHFFEIQHQLAKYGWDSAILTTYRFFNFLTLSNNLTTDANFKLIWQGHHCMVVGVLDNTKRFCPIGFNICDSQDTSD